MSTRTRILSTVLAAGALVPFAAPDPAARAVAPPVTVEAAHGPLVDVSGAVPVSHRRTRRPASPAMLACIRRWESGTSGGYRARSRTGRFTGAYQFDQRTWNSVAPRGWRGVRPMNAPPAVQDEAARRLYAQRGLQPWPGRSRRNCARHA